MMVWTIRPYRRVLLKVIGKDINVINATTSVSKIEATASKAQRHSYNLNTNSDQPK